MQTLIATTGTNEVAVILDHAKVCWTVWCDTREQLTTLSSRFRVKKMYYAVGNCTNWEWIYHYRQRQDPVPYNHYTGCYGVKYSKDGAESQTITELPADYQTITELPAEDQTIIELPAVNADTDIDALWNESEMLHFLMYNGKYCGQFEGAAIKKANIRNRSSRYTEEKLHIAI